MTSFLSALSVLSARVFTTMVMGGLSCDGRHEMSDLGAAGEPVHRCGEKR